MTARLAACFRNLRLGLLALALLGPAFPASARADELADFHAAVIEAAAQYRVALTTLETSGRDETAAEVRRFRQAWQAVIERFGRIRTIDRAHDPELAATFMQVDVRIIGTLLVIEMGNRDAARDSLAPIAEVLVSLQTHTAP
jgi:hypothetical protein